MNSGNKIKNCAYFLRIESGYLPASFACNALLHSTASALDKCMATFEEHNGHTLAGFFLGRDDNEVPRACALMGRLRLRGTVCG